MNEEKKLEKFRDLMREVQDLAEKQLQGRPTDIDLEISQIRRELRQMVERLRYLSDGDLTYEAVETGEPTI